MDAQLGLVTAKGLSTALKRGQLMRLDLSQNPLGDSGASLKECLLRCGVPVEYRGALRTAVETCSAGVVLVHAPVYVMFCVCSVPQYAALALALALF